MIMFDDRIDFSQVSRPELERMLVAAEARVAKYRELAGMGGGSREVDALEYWTEEADELRLELRARADREGSR